MDYRAAKKIWPKDILDLNRNFCSKPAKYRTDTWKLQNFYNNLWFTICPYFLFFFPKEVHSCQLTIILLSHLSFAKLFIQFTILMAEWTLK